MKKVTINFIMSMAVVVLMLGIIVFLELCQEIDGTGSGFDALIGIAIFLVEIVVGGYALLLFVFAAIARAVFSKQGKGVIIYRILMGIEYVLQGGFVLFCIKVMSVPLMILAALVAAAIVYGGINTYTDRILD